MRDRRRRARTRPARPAIRALASGGTSNEAPEGGNLFTAAGREPQASARRGGSPADGEPGTVTLANAIVANPRDGGDCGFGTEAEPIITEGGNIDSDDTCGLDDSSDQTATDPLLGTLASNGGPTRTHLPQTGSPATDRGLDADCPDDDQRDVARPQDGDDDGTATCDSGAVEVVFEADPPDPDDPPAAQPAQAVQEQPDFTG